MNALMRMQYCKDCQLTSVICAVEHWELASLKENASLLEKARQNWQLTSIVYTVFERLLVSSYLKVANYGIIPETYTFL